VIRLARVEFATAVPRGPDLTPARVTEMVREQGFDPKADMATRTVHLGDDIYPFERVLRMRKATPEAGELGKACPECGEDKFDTENGLAAHRRHSHGVKGTWRKGVAPSNEEPGAVAFRAEQPTLTEGKPVKR